MGHRTQDIGHGTWDTGHRIQDTEHRAQDTGVLVAAYWLQTTDDR